VSEELENSLQQAIETYLGERLRAIDEQLSRLQNDFGEALTRLRQSSASESLDGTSLSAAIFAHLQTARGQKLSEEIPARDEGSDEVATIKRAVEEIERQQSHSDILGSLLTGAAQFAERAALFVIKNEQAIGWRECEASDPSNLELIGGVSLPLSADTLLSRAAQSHSAWTGAPGSNSDNSLLIDQLGGEPQTVAAVPLVARGKVVAVLYADSSSPDPNAVNADALELLARVAAMAVNLAAVPRAVPEKQPSAPEVVEPVTVAEPEVAPTFAKAEQAPEPEPTYTPEIEPQIPVVVAEASSEEVPAATIAEYVSEVVVEPAAAEVYPDVSLEPTVEYVPVEVIEPVVEVYPEVSAGPAVEYAPEEIAEPEQVEEAPAHATAEHVPEEIEEPGQVEEVPVEATAEHVPEEVAESAPEPPTPSPVIESVAPSPAAPGFGSQYAAPLGSVRRYGLSESDLPIEVGEEERRLHNDARRFARLLVSEIKLYNEPKVKEGRSRSDIYDRLREDIDRSRQMYDKRVAPPVAARHDYFHQELVNTLAEGDPAKLGASYPGAVVVAAN
jgi:hypothetical protein